ncbi:MAG: PIN domain-containing protein [Saprospiraceae bacterium]|nr:PIN domain-containing protein [Saprospiraceae bacterium]MCF8252245.1 PIN domain-containing protein [Saprospiraceae bacterium]MCF8282348.1 PIN domain-containing protein [Bacteroidales bacterium]MCF8313875.1 PIN domain-containing protein [Saprospiraceae bacterium]MCF8442894.1 PIN domain-containing protein [Saprospiraceae bacterium]
MKYLLDTNIVVHFLRGAYRLDEKVREVGIQNCFVSEITLLELEYGVENSEPSWQERQRVALDNFIEVFTGRILPIREAFNLYAKNRSRLRKAGTPISDFDLLIGTTAVLHKFIIVSDNVTELSRIENIQLENWIIRPKK